MPELTRSLFERLRVLARGPRSYGEDDSQIGSLLKRGLVQETGRGVTKHPYTGQPRREYEITEAGQIVLSEQGAGAGPPQRAGAMW